MSDYYPTVGIFSKDSYFISLFQKFLEKKNFKVQINPKKTEGVDYFVVNIASGIDLLTFNVFFKNVTSKCLVILGRKNDQLSANIFKLNQNIKVCYLSLSGGDVVDYSENIFKELMSFGHSNKVFKLKGKVIKKIDLPEPKTKKTEIKNTAPNKISFENKSTKPRKKKIKLKVNWKKVVLVLSSIISLLLVPMISLLLSFGSLILSLKLMLSKPKLSTFFEKLSRSSALFVNSFNFGIKTYSDGAELSLQSLNLFSDVKDIYKNAVDISDGINSDRPYDLNTLSTNLAANLDSLYSDFGFFKGTLDSQNSYTANLLKDKLQEKNIDTSILSQKIYSAKEIASGLPSILGKDKTKKYLVLFQNNMELRPTGGFIGSFALLTFNGGKLTDMSVSDVYSADGQLKGHVDPPEPIRDILGEGGWYLRDANWDPDFPTSASKIEWFLDKEINEQVDGTVAIDLYFVQNILKAIGPMTLPDFDKTVTADNLYQITQSEVEDEFFPGSTKKTSFMTSLSKSLITELKNLNSNLKPRILSEVAKSLEEKHIQVFLHENNLFKSFDNLGYTGSLDLSTDCGIRCLQDKYILVDANLGVNKANFYVERSQKLNINLEKENIGHELVVTYKNNAGKLLGNSGRYKTYTRLILPVDAYTTTLRVYDEFGNYQDVDFDEQIISGRKEIGFLLEVPPEKVSRVQIYWNLSQTQLPNGGEYNLDVFKQAGTDTDFLQVNINNKGLSLTNPMASGYNTSLDTDFSLKVFLK